MTPQRVFVHVGSPKTGTTYLQTLLWDHRQALRDDHGILFPGDRYDAHFLAAVDLQDCRMNAEPRPDAQGHWARLLEEVRSWPGTVVISHELLAGARPEHVRRAIADLAPAEVHIIHTVRDLAGQLPSNWQEDVKHGAVDTFDEWWASVCARDETHPYTSWFWPTVDPLDVHARWGSVVPPERYHVVSVPRAGSSGLWDRFCAVIGLDPTAVDLAATSVSNSGLGLAEVELVRRLNLGLEEPLAPTVYERLVKGALAHETLVRRPGATRLAVPAELVPQLREIAQGWLTGLRRTGVDLRIDEDDLLPRTGARTGSVSGTTDEQLAETAVWALREILLKLERERGEHAGIREGLEAGRRHLTEELDRTRAELEGTRAELATARAELQGVRTTLRHLQAASWRRARQLVARRIARHESARPQLSPHPVVPAGRPPVPPRSEGRPPGRSGRSSPRTDRDAARVGRPRGR
jgi:hypothetical protein